MGELVTLLSSDIRRDPVSGLLVVCLSGKNENSRRVVPIPQALMDLGFLAYVESTRRQLDQPLFPHRAANATRIADPSKHLSRAFGEHLDRIGMDDSRLVFHSMRHTVISRMHLCRVPVADAELIVGHAAQDAAVRADAARSHASWSGVHLGTYTHAAEYVLNGEPLHVRLKRHLDTALQFRLDHPRLRMAAQIVLEHTKYVGSAHSATAGPPAGTPTPDRLPTVKSGA